MRNFIASILPPLLIAAILSIIYILPKDTTLKESAIRPDLPINYNATGWYGVSIQESEKERAALAADTKFSKARYVPANGDRTPPVEVSIVYSGSDMNSSIHRPERCLPTQGHNNLLSTEHDVVLDDGRVLRFTRLTSKSYPAELKDAAVKHIDHINYYLFIGHESIETSHLSRTFRDMIDRVLKGYVQRWAYLQIGTYWGDAVHRDAASADKDIQDVIRKVIPQVMDWSRIDEAGA